MAAVFISIWHVLQTKNSDLNAFMDTQNVSQRVFQTNIYYDSHDSLDQNSTGGNYILDIEIMQKMHALGLST